MGHGSATDTLQAEVAALKKESGKALHIKKAGPHTPFPLSLIFDIDPSEEVLNTFDLGQIQVLVTVTEDILSRSDDAGLSIKLSCESLPQQLSCHVAQQLHSHWVQRRHADSAQFHLAAIPQRMRSACTQLISALPELLEPYESVNASGATVRRYAFAQTSQVVFVPTPAPAKHPATTAQLPASAGPPAAASRTSTRPAAPAGMQPELVYLQKRFGQGCRVQQPAADAQPAGAQCFSLSFKPSDPAWPHQAAALSGSISPAYPAPEAWQLTLEPGQPVAAAVAGVLGKLLRHEGLRHSTQPLRAALRHFDARAVELLNVAEDVVMEASQARPQQAALPGQSPNPSVTSDMVRLAISEVDAHDEQAPADSHKPAAQSSTAGLSAGDDHSDTATATSAEHTYDEYAYDDTSGSSSDPDSDAAPESSSHPDAAEPGFQLAGSSRRLVELVGLKLDGLDVLDPYQLHLQLACDRCGKQAELTQDMAQGPGKQAVCRPSAAMQCANCHLPWSFEAQARMVHAFSNVLATVRSEGCTPVDLLPSTLAGQCSSCGAVAALRQVQASQITQRDCSRCHSALTLLYSAATFALASDASAQGRTARPRQRQRRAERSDGQPAGVAPGKALPATGTCKHYAHSHRWLRFPCCGMRFPCDLCHEEGTDGHEMVWATRMLCGFCSTEQPMGSRCKACDKKLARSAANASGTATYHWEGGKGCRDAKRMDRRDAHKYRGSKAKTVSKKSRRVGQAGARKRTTPVT